MRYEVKKNKILIKDIDEFNPKHILESGQIFSYSYDGLKWHLVSKDNYAKIKENNGKVEIETDEVDYFIDFFDLNTDYKRIKMKLIGINNYLDDAIKFGYGIRIMKQDIFQTIVSFILSANNNIKRFSKTIKTLCKDKGKKLYEGVYAFPNITQLTNVDMEYYKSIGAGYRAKYLYLTIKKLISEKEYFNKSLATNELKSMLLKLDGVGPKVADCILLFGYNRMDVFPVDTWIAKVFKSIFNKDLTRIEMSKILVEKFKHLSGYAQQYLFYFEKEKGN